MTPPNEPISAVVLQGLPVAPWYTDAALWWTVLAAIAFTGLTGAATWVWATMAPDRRVYNILSLKLRLRPAERAVIERLAVAHAHASPVALLLSPGTFDSAIAAAAAGGQIVDPDAATRLRRRVFG